MRPQTRVRRMRPAGRRRNRSADGIRDIGYDLDILRAKAAARRARQAGNEQETSS